uniref:EsaB/YukD family protein n=1 Tax=uncultured Corynebacterium sp. TaxID=159447 RepID=UPI0025DC071E
MTATFVRVSVFRNDRQLDVSLPAHRPVQELLDDVVGLLAPEETTAAGENGLGPGTTVVTTDTWVLSSPATGALDPQTTIAEEGLLDGDRLFLTQQPDAARSPFVDDVMAEVRHTVGEDRWGWSGPLRSAGMVATAGASLLMLLLPGLWASLQAPGRIADWDTENWTVAAILVLAGLSSLAVAVRKPAPAARWSGVALPVVVAAVVWPLLRQSAAGEALSALLALCAAATVPCAWAAGAVGEHRRWAGALAAGLVALAAALVWGATTVGASTVAVLAWSSWVPVLVLLIAPTIGVSTSGLPALLRRNDAGESIARSTIRDRALRAESTTDAAVWAATALGFLTAVTLGSGAYWQHGLIAAVLSTILLLRTTGYSDARTIAPLLIAGITSLAVTAGSVPQWVSEETDPVAHLPWWLAANPAGDHGWTCWAACAVVVFLGAMLCLVLREQRSNDVSEARTAKFISMVDTMATLAF